jgi:hypothetical protein
MLRKICLAIAGTMLLSGVAAAASFGTPASPTSVNDTGPNYPAPTTALSRSAGATGPVQSLQLPSSVSESMPEMTGGQAHPTMGTGATRAPQAARDIPGPSSVSESMPEMAGGQSHPTMGH